MPASNKIYRKFPVGSLIAYRSEIFWWEDQTSDPYNTFGIIIHSDQTFLYILIDASIIELDKKSLNKIKVIQRPYSKYV